MASAADDAPLAPAAAARRAVAAPAGGDGAAAARRCSAVIVLGLELAQMARAAADHGAGALRDRRRLRARSMATSSTTWRPTVLSAVARLLPRLRDRPRPRRDRHRLAARPRRPVLRFGVVLDSIPLIALTPILMVWVGNGITSRIVIATIAALFPLLVGRRAGLQGGRPQRVASCSTFSPRRAGSG